MNLAYVIIQPVLFDVTILFRKKIIKIKLTVKTSLYRKSDLCKENEVLIAH